MKRKSIFIFAISAYAIASSHSLMAQSSGTTEVPEDSIANYDELQEVVVEGKNQTAKAGILSFIPTNTQKKAAHDGYDLLRRLDMPQIYVDPQSNSVTALSGYGLSIFINGIPASTQEVQALKPTDVLRVVYLDFPTDTKYRNAQHAIDFIVKQYEWGGYTKLSTKSRFINNTHVNTDIASKFAYKRMTYDLFAGWNYSNSHLGGSIKNETFSLLNNNGDAYTVNRQEETTKYRSKNQGIPISFRAVYNSNKLTVTNTVGFSFYENPGSFNNGSIAFNNNEYSNSTYSRSSQSISRNASWSGNLNWQLPRNYQLNIFGDVTYGHSNTSSLYRTDIPQFSPIENITRENIYNIISGFNFSKQISTSSTLRLYYNVHNYHNDVNYSGSSPYNNKLDNLSMMGNLFYTASFNNVMTNLYVGAVWLKQSINDKRTYKTTPNIGGYISWSPNRSHQINTYAQYNGMLPGEATLSPNVIQTNELLYTTGNPDIKLWNNYFFGINHTWFISNKLSTFVQFRIEGQTNPVSYIYYHYNNGQSLIKKPIQNGKSYNWELVFNPTYKPIPALQLRLGLAYQPSTISTDKIKRSIHPVNGMVEGTYYIGNCFVSARAFFNARSLDAPSYVITYAPWGYNISGGWNYRRLKVQLSFRDASARTHYDMYQPLYSYNSTDLYKNKSITLSVNYTISYGKHVRQGDEIGEQKGAASAVLK